MKKSLLAVAVLGAFAGAASAQSSVTLFGIVDLSAASLKNGNTTQKELKGSQLDSSRLGFRGTEDLGGGLSVGFWLEGDVRVDTGTGAATNGTGPTGGFNFNRKSTLSLTSKMGEIRLGRDYTNTFLTAATHDAFGAEGLGSIWNMYLSGPAGLGSGANTVVRGDNMIGYFLPGGLGGLYGSVQVAAGEGVKGNKYAGGRLGWATGPIDVSASFSETDTATADKYKIANVGASYDFGMFKLNGLLDQRKYGSLKYNTYAISTSVPLGQGEFRASYAKGDSKGAGIDGNDAKLFSLAYIYNLSKRTALYTMYGNVKNEGASNISLGGTVSATDSAAGGFTSTGYAVGVRHSF